jgi:hypothetical protein
VEAIWQVDAMTIAAENLPIAVAAAAGGVVAGMSASANAGATQCAIFRRLAAGMIFPAEFATMLLSPGPF